MGFNITRRDLFVDKANPTQTNDIAVQERRLGDLIPVYPRAIGGQQVGYGDALGANGHSGMTCGHRGIVHHNLIVCAASYGAFTKL